MWKGIFIGILLVLSQMLVAQDIKIEVSELTYDSDFERQAFADVANQNTDYFALLLAADETVTTAEYEKWKSSFQQKITGLNSTLITKKKNDKKAQFLYEKIHGGFLTKYEEVVPFSRIFKDGVYNCVSATALYSLVFDNFEIPYAVQEKPTHVYLVAFPAQERVQIETTTPIGGYRTFDQTFKQQYVKRLMEYKLISSSEYQSKSIDELFDKHFFNSEVINLTQLAGIQYYNSALSYIDKDLKEKAFQQLEKYHFLYPGEKSRFLMFALAMDNFNQLTYQDPRKANYLAKLCKFTREGITPDMLTSEFYRITEVVFMQNGNREKYEGIYTVLMNNITNAETKSQITYIYNYEIGRTLYNQSRYADAIPFLEAALAAKPNSVDLNNLFIATLTQIRANSNDSQGFIVQLQQYGEKYAGLKQNNTFFELLGVNILKCFTQAYEKGNTTEGEKYKVMFEELLIQNPTIPTRRIEYEIGRAYSTACVYYFKRNQAAKAKVFITKGLSYAPDNYELRSRQEMLR